MSVFDTVESCELTNAHGEVNFFRVTAGRPDLTGFVPLKPGRSGYIVGHSESGHHHILDAEGVDVMERTREGMKVLYAIVRSPATLRQDAGDPHARQIVEPGEYIITNNVEYDPFLEQARRVAD
jgi:hypothetical protein